jgi:hypothetical protein
MEVSRPHSVASRLKHAVMFAVTVWALAASFVAFELLGFAFTRVMVANPEQAGDLLVSAATLQSSACDVAVNEAAGQAGALGEREAKADAWMLGVHFGSDTQSAAQRAPGSTLQGNGEVERLSTELAVPAPRAFSAQNFASAHDEFVTHVEADAGGTAHRLAVSYSPEACRLFKLGAFWGYTMRIRVTLPGTSTVMSIPINYYARQVAMPEALTRAMITPMAAGGSRADRAAEAIALTEAVTRHLKGEQ